MSQMRSKAESLGRLPPQCQPKQHSAVSEHTGKSPRPVYLISAYHVENDQAASVGRGRSEHWSIIEFWLRPMTAGAGTGAC